VTVGALLSTQVKVQTDRFVLIFSFFKISLWNMNISLTQNENLSTASRIDCRVGQSDTKISQFCAVYLRYPKYINNFDLSEQNNLICTRLFYFFNKL
jgi:hypothetical protein